MNFQEIQDRIYHQYRINQAHEANRKSVDIWATPDMADLFHEQVMNHYRSHYGLQIDEVMATHHICMSFMRQPVRVYHGVCDVNYISVNVLILTFENLCSIFAIPNYYEARMLDMVKNETIDVPDYVYSSPWFRPIVIDLIPDHGAKKGKKNAPS